MIPELRKRIQCLCEIREAAARFRPPVIMLGGAFQRLCQSIIAMERTLHEQGVIVEYKTTSLVDMDYSEIERRILGHMLQGQHADMVELDSLPLEYRTLKSRKREDDFAMFYDGEYRLSAEELTSILQKRSAPRHDESEYKRKPWLRFQHNHESNKSRRKGRPPKGR